MRGCEHATVSTRHRIFAAHSCCACFVAGEPGGGSISRRGVGGCAAGGCVEVQEQGGGREGLPGACRRRVAVGGDVPPYVLRGRDGEGTF